MTGLIRALLVGAVAIGVTANAFADEGKKKEYFEANRAGWMLGIYMGEEKGQPHPFVLEVAPKSEAYIKGIKPGDELIRLDDEEVRELSRAFNRANKMRVGRTVELWMRRGVQNIKFEIRVPKTANGVDEEKAGKGEKKTGDENAGDTGDEKKKKKKKKGPVVIKPIPPSEGK